MDKLEKKYYEIYLKKGINGVFDKSFRDDRIKDYLECYHCDTETPRHPKNNMCLVCGQ